jgi:exonuclease VII small subunit
MLLDQVFEKFEHVKWVFKRVNGKLKKVRKVISANDTENNKAQKKPMFPISKERK